MKTLTKWRIIIGNILFAIAVGFFYFKINAPPSYRMTTFILLIIVLAIGTMNEYKVRMKDE